MSKDWKAIARAQGFEIGETAPLDGLEKTFRPLVADLSVELEPDFTFDPREDGE